MRRYTYLDGLGVIAVVTLACAACDQLVGVRELTIAATGSTPDASALGDSSVEDSGIDGDDALARCVDLQTDPANCGQCGRRCDNGGCSEGVCEAFTVARDVPGVSSLAQESTYLYWSIQGPSSVIHGGHKDLRDQVPAVQRVKLAEPHALAYSAWGGTTGWLYWALSNGGTPSFGDIERCPASAKSSGCSEGSPGPIAKLQKNVTSIATETGTLGVAWNDESDENDLGGSIYYYNPNSAKIITIADKLHLPRAVAIDAGGVYFTVREGLAWCPRAGCGAAPPAVAHLGDLPADKLALDGRYAYVSTIGAAGQIWRVGLIDGVTRKFEAPLLIVDNQPQVTALTASGGNAYWATRGVADGDGTILRAGGPGKPLVLARSQDDPTGIVVDDRAAYWATRGTKSGESRILRVIR